MRPRANRRGSHAIEFALVLPILLSIVSGIVDYGQFYSSALSVINATREGGRSGAADDSDVSPDACTTAENATVTALHGAGFSTATTSNVSAAVTVDGTTGDKILTVNSQLNFSRLFGLVPAPNQLKGRIVVRLEDQANSLCSNAM